MHTSIEVILSQPKKHEDTQLLYIWEIQIIIVFV